MTQRAGGTSDRLPPARLPRPLLQLEQLQQAVVQLLKARQSVLLHNKALEELKGSYQASGETTDFARQLSERAQQLGEQPP